MQDTVGQSSVLANRISQLFLQPQENFSAMALVCGLSMKSINYSNRATLKGSGNLCGKTKPRDSDKYLENKDTQPSNVISKNESGRILQNKEPAKNESGRILQIKEPAKNEPGSQNVCAEHNLQFEDFCRQDEQLVCSICKHTDHKGHQMENLSKVLNDYEGKARILAGKLDQKSQEIERGLEHIQSCVDCVASKKIQFKKFISETITTMIRNLIVTGNQYQSQIDQWERDILNENQNLVQAWKYATREYNTTDPFEVARIEENLRKLDSLESEKANKENFQQLERYDPRNFVEQIVEFKFKAEEELNKLKGLIFKSQLFSTSDGAREFKNPMTIK